MNSEDFEGISKKRRAAKRANAMKTSNVLLMPWEKRHQHTMVKFLEKTATSQASAKVDQNYANSTLEQKFHTGNSHRIINYSGKSANENAEEDLKKNRNDQCALSVSNVGGTISSSFKEKSLEFLDVQASSVYKDTSQLKSGTAELTCNSVLLKESSTYNTYQEQQHKLCGNKVTENPPKRNYTSLTTTSGQAAKYSLDEVFKYEHPKIRRPLRERLEFSISPTHNINSKHRNEEKNKAFPRSFEYLAKYDMEEVFKLDRCKIGKSISQILGQLS